MTSRNTRPATFHQDQVAAYQKARLGESGLDLSQNFSAIITGVVILLAIASSYLSPDGTPGGALAAIGHLVWDAIITIIPARLLFAIDDWTSSSTSSPSHRRPMLDSKQNRHAAKSEALHRVMGLDRPGGMMYSIFRARTRALSMTGSVLGLKLDFEKRPPGLGNRDNSCYQNSILQGLASLSSMPDYLSTCVKGVKSEDDDEAGKNVAETLRALISDLNDSSNSGATLWTPTLLKSMSTWTQQDAQEYYSVILDDIDKGAALAIKAMASSHIAGLEDSAGAGAGAKDEACVSEHSDDSGYQSSASSMKLSDTKTVRNPLEGLLAQRVSCVQCGHSDGLSMVPFNCLTLSLGLDKHHHTLYERLDSYSRVETIEGVECAKCTLLKAQGLLAKLVEKLRQRGTPEDKLDTQLRRLEAIEAALEEDRFDESFIKDTCKIPHKVSTTKTKQMVIARPPQSLVIHINRSVFDPSTFNMIKNSAPVNFPMVLDLGPWCLGSAEIKPTTETTTTTVTSTTTTAAAEAGEERWEMDPMASMVAGDVAPSRLAGPIYELKAAVTHYGRHENGHYICYRKYPRPAFSPTFEEEKRADSKKEKNGDSEEEEKKTEEDDGDMEWWRLSDHNVSKVDEELVTSLSPGVFMLFYECVDPTMILQYADAHDESKSDASSATEQ